MQVGRQGPVVVRCAVKGGKHWLWAEKVADLTLHKADFADSDTGGDSRWGSYRQLLGSMHAHCHAKKYGSSQRQRGASSGR